MKLTWTLIVLALVLGVVAGLTRSRWCSLQGAPSTVGRYTLHFSPAQTQGPFLLDTASGRVWQAGYPVEEATPEWRWLPRREEFENQTAPSVR